MPRVSLPCIRRRLEEAVAARGPLGSCRNVGGNFKGQRTSGVGARRRGQGSGHRGQGQDLVEWLATVLHHAARLAGPERRAKLRAGQDSR